MKPAYVGGYRVTDKVRTRGFHRHTHICFMTPIPSQEALKIAIEAAGQVRTTCEQMLSKVCEVTRSRSSCKHPRLTNPGHTQGPAIPMIRRHTKGDGEIHFEPALRVISGNYVTAKRRGVIDGVDFGYTGVWLGSLLTRCDKVLKLGFICILLASQARSGLSSRMTLGTSWMMVTWCCSPILGSLLWESC